MVDIHELPCVPEMYEPEWLEGIPREYLDTCEMTDTERRFLNGLIRQSRPLNLLEIGVAEGGSSLVMLNAIRDIPGARLTSIDIMEKFWADESKDVGWAVEAAYPSEALPWTLIKGKDPVEVIEELGGPFDFCLIDTAHVHPIESLNFLCVYPFLSKNAVVVIHDIALFTKPEFSQCLANAILFNTLVGNKLKPEERIPNIGAVQINDDTGIYLENVFGALLFMWHMFPRHLKIIKSFIKAHYPERLANLANEAFDFYKANKFENSFFVADESGKPAARCPSNRRDEVLNASNVIAYGAGRNYVILRDIMEACDVRPFDEVWDKDAAKRQQDLRIPVGLPNLKSLIGRDDCSMIITLQNPEIAMKIAAELESCGFTNYVFFRM